jgi:hypothetical protein
VGTFRASASALLALLLAAGCATTRSVREAPQTSGFLGDYSQLRPGEEVGGVAQLVYVKPELDLSGYRAVRIEPVALWGGEKMKSLPREDQQRMVDSLHAALTSKLAQDWTIVDAAGPGVLVVRAAITSGEPSNVPLDVVASVIPQVSLLSRVAGIAADSSLTVGEAGAEIEITDAGSGERLLAAVDRRVGGRSWTGMTDKWSDVDEAYAFWAERIRVRLAEFRGQAATPAAEKK